MRMHFVALILAALLLVAPVVGPDGSSQVLAQEPSARAQVSADWTGEKIDLAQLFDAVVDAVDKDFFDQAALNQGHWRERAQAMRPAVLASPTIGDAVRQINALLAQLGASHTALYTPNDEQYYVLPDVLGTFTRTPMRDLINRRFWGSGPYYPGIGAFTRNVDGRNFVDGVLEGSPADRAGLKFGDEIVSVDGRPYGLIESFRDKIGSTVELMIRRTAGAAPERVMAAVIPVRPVQAFSDATEASAHVIERNGRRIGYLHVWALAESNSFTTALRELDPWPFACTHEKCLRTDGSSQPITEEMPNSLDALIVDLRGRVGGNVGVAGQLLKQLDGDSYWGTWQAFSRSDGARLPVTGQPSFRGRSAMLVDAHTRSAGEIVAYGYKRSAFGPLFGTRTAGAVLSGALHPMPGDLMLYLAMAGHEIDGHRLEGAGVDPDFRVEQPLPYAQGVDPVLDAAADFLSSAKAK
ncbi:MAG TPA: S41 family peptidase [Xanthobacteraceae bacterium]|nr:S41 family peptidase [Xanthobacteraceae bacterium]